ncbi:PH domain-containing protein [Streptomyces sp. NPDC058954]|uniref:PH domain-containing protein n=1 Tax=Streptomyces sp. NPDC058954 TaxID=3346677 RepID=UPI00367D8005
MTTPEPSTPATATDRVHRSSAGIAGGVLLLAITLWLGIDAIVAGHGRTPWLALAAMILVIPLIVAFTLRPAVQVNDERLRIRNPFRLIVLPWGEVAALRSGYSNEVVDKSGTKYQLWAVPVSLRARKRAARQEARNAADRAAGASGGGRRGGLGGVGRLGAGGFGGGVPDGATRAPADRVMDDLRETLGERGEKESAQGEVTVRWAYEVAGPALAGAVLLVILVATG